MKIASIANRDAVVRILSASFKDNLSVNFIISPIGDRHKRIKRLMEYSFDLCMLFGEVWLSDDEHSCALILFPDRRKVTMKGIWMDIKLIFTSIGVGRIFKALNRETLIKKMQLRGPMCYLWFIGVEPTHQRRGFGSNLLAEIIQHVYSIEKSLLLETSTPENLPWYKDYGFEVYDRLELTYTLYFLKNIHKK